MSQKEINPKIEWCNVKNNNCLKFTFNGTLTKDDAVKATAQWREYLSPDNINNVNIVWECTNMTGYEPMARSVWQSALKDLKSKIACIWLITESRLIKTGAQLMSVFTSYNFKVVNSEDKIEF